MLVPEEQPDGATVLSVALFAQCFLVHGIIQPVVASRQSHFRAEDDVGTRYLARRGGGGGVPGRTMEFTYVFSGGVPAEASTLTIARRWVRRDRRGRAPMTPPERRVADVFLSELYLLLLARPDVADRMVERLGWAVAACARVGLLPPADEEIWRGRTERLTSPRRRPATQVKQAALAHLETIREQGDRLGLQAAATAFEQIGLLTRKQAFEWRFNKLRDPARESWRPRQEFAGRGEPRIIPGPPERAAGFRLLAVAIYEDHSPRPPARPSTATSTPESLQLGQFAPDGPGLDEGDRNPAFADDLDTDYRMSTSVTVPFGFTLDAITTTTAIHTRPPPRTPPGWSCARARARCASTCARIDAPTEGDAMRAAR